MSSKSLLRGVHTFSLSFSHLRRCGVKSFFPLSLTSQQRGCSSPTNTPGKVRVRVLTAAGQTTAFTAPVGMTLMEALRDVGRVEIEAACDGTCACSTCHVVLRPEDYRLAGEPTEDEMDMLDLAPGVKETSRLACQVELTEAMDNMEVQMPAETHNQLS